MLPESYYAIRSKKRTIQIEQNHYLNKLNKIHFWCNYSLVIQLGGILFSNKQLIIKMKLANQKITTFTHTLMSIGWEIL